MNVYFLRSLSTSIWDCKNRPLMIHLLHDVEYIVNSDNGLQYAANYMNMVVVVYECVDV